MLKAVLLCVVLSVVIEARPKWQSLPALPGYVPVYIVNGDTPLEEVNLELAEAFHVLPAGRSAAKQIDAAPEIPELPPAQEAPQADQPSDNIPPIPEESAVDRRPYEKKIQKKKVTITKPIERR